MGPQTTKPYPTPTNRSSRSFTSKSKNASSFPTGLSGFTHNFDLCYFHKSPIIIFNIIIIIMAHSTSSAAATVFASTFTTASYHKNIRLGVASLGCINASGAASPSPHGSESHAVSVSHNKATANRRMVALGLTGAMAGSMWHEPSAFAAGRRPPPPPPVEKKDPSISGVQAKILASKKRKEAMKESMAKLRERGKPVGPSGPSSSESE